MIKLLSATQFKKLLEHHKLKPDAPISEQQLFDFANAAFHIGRNVDVMKATFKEKKI